MPSIVLSLVHTIRCVRVTISAVAAPKDRLYLIVADDFPRLIHHLGPRYCGTLQDPAIVRFLTYDASTSLNMFLVTLVSKAATPVDLSPLVKAVKNGLSVEESCIVFSISPSSLRDDAQIIASGSRSMPTTPSSAFFQTHAIASMPQTVELVGDATTASAACLDMALWKIGGAAICLRLVQLAHVSLLCPFTLLPPS